MVTGNFGRQRMAVAVLIISGNARELNPLN
jgi:hypothetical protein